MAEYMTTTRIGDVVDIVVHSKAHPKDCERAKREKRGHTSLAQKARNDKGSAGYMALVALGNFSRRDLYLTFTYDDYNHPPNMKAVKADGERLMRRLRDMWRDFGTDLKYMRVIEGLETGKRYHHHMMVNCPPGCDLAALKAVLDRLWPCGAVHTERIGKGRDRGAYSLALYFQKETRAYGRPAGNKAFSCSTNLYRGETITEIIPDNTPVDFPANVPASHQLEKDMQQRLYSRYVHIRYVLPSRSTDGGKHGKNALRPRAQFGLEQAITFRHKEQKNVRRAKNSPSVTV